MLTGRLLMNTYDMTDDEVIEQINETLDEDGRIRKDMLEMECVQGRLVLSGRVATDEELQILDEIMNDVLEIDEYENNVWVDDTLAFEVSNEDSSEDVRFDMGDEDDDGLEADDSFSPDDDEDM